MILAILDMKLRNLVAIIQTSICMNRMLAYLSIDLIGYVTIEIVVEYSNGEHANMITYTLFYIVMDGTKRFKQILTEWLMLVSILLFYIRKLSGCLQLWKG